MSIPFEIAEKLKCSECNQYLSSTPVKVYHDKKVKCSRCAEVGDGGVRSILYETVADYVKFPCINHYAGCKELLSHYEVRLHELRCSPTFYLCPVCDFHVKPSHAVTHITKHHQNVILKNPLFKIKTNEGDQKDTYFYLKDSLVAAAYCEYDSTTQEVQFNMGVLGITTFRNVKYDVKLSSDSDDELIKKINQTSCVDLSDVRKECKITKISCEKSVGDKILCEFEISDVPSMALKRAWDFQQQSSNSVTFVINNISNLQDYTRINSEVFYVNRAPWVAFVQKNKVKKEWFLGVCLRHFSNAELTVAAKVTLMSCNKNKCKSDSFKEQTPIMSLGFPQFIKWDAFINLENGYIHNDIIKIQAEIDILCSTEENCKTKKCFCG